MRKHRFSFSLFIPVNIMTKLLTLAVSALVLTACGSGDNAPGPSSVPDPVVSQTPEPTPTPSPEPVTEEELRRAIAELDASENAVLRKQEYYERLYAMDLFEEEDYLALAQIYGEKGDWENQRLMLFKVLRLYPCREYAQMLSDIVMRGDSSDTELASLANQITEALEQQDPLSLLGLFQDFQWRQVFVDELAGIESRVQYTNNGSVLQITTDSVNTEITWHTASGGFFLCRNSSAGILLISASLEDGTYNGSFSTAYFDPSGTELKSAQGTLSGGVCVDQLTIRYQGTEYTGAFDSDGVTLAEQLKEVSQKGGVLYAYDSKKTAYLYQKETTVQEFRVDASFLGLPEYTEWQ